MKLNLTDGNLYFRKISGEKGQYPYLCKNVDCDALVIGGGISGVITAYYLSKENLNVVLIDKNILGYGSSAAANNILEYQSSIDMLRLNKIMGEKNAKKFCNFCLQSIGDLEKIIKEISEKVDTKGIEFERCNSIYYTNKYMNKNQLLREYSARAGAGLAVDLIEEHNILDLKYGINLNSGSAVINGYELVQRLAEYLSKLDNVKIYENTEAINIKSREEEVEIITHNKFKIKTKKVIITEGAEVIKEFPDMPIELYRIFTIVTDPIKNVDKEFLGFTAKDMDLPCHYIRFTDDKRIIFSGESLRITEKNRDEKIMKHISNVKYRKLFKALQEIMPNLGEVTVRYCFNGIMPQTKDGLPIIDEIQGYPNVFCNLAYGVNGTLYSIIGAKILEEINDQCYYRDIHLFKIKR